MNIWKPYILDLLTTWRWMFKTRPRYPQVKCPQHPMDRRLCDPQGRAGRRREGGIVLGLDPSAVTLHRLSDKGKENTKINRKEMK
jgi:hypothetical protein